MHGAVHMVQETQPAHEWAALAREASGNMGVMGDNGALCALCCNKCEPEKLAMCERCHLTCCIDCIEMHTCDKVTVVQRSLCPAPANLCTPPPLRKHGLV